MESREIRTKFLEFFARREHRIVPSDTLVPSNDPTLLFTSAGMVQFKDNFLGRSPDPMKRATTCQKCFRTSDIDNVGYTARHHTFFEMLGNFSFGDYFKREAIHWGWEFVTTVLHLQPDRLYPTVFENDDEAFGIWEKEIGVPASRIQRKGREDNFWGPVGGSGPCGPCSEILYDQGSHIREQDDRFLEIWNLVFVQFDAQPDGSYPEIARKSIDTGAGLERITAVMQKVDTNFETDLFRPYLHRLQDLTGKAFGQDHETSCSMRVIADHIRATTFAISDRVVPSNIGRGYVLRRIMRRAMLHGTRLGLGEGFLTGLVPLVVETMKEIYPDLVPAQEHVMKVVSHEEEAFHRTLSKGSTILQDRITELKSNNKNELSGAEAFRLYDTYGFPIELTMEILKENGMSCSLSDFQQQMEDQRQRAKAAWKGSGAQALADAEGIEEIPATDFTGYFETECEAEIEALFKDGKKVTSLKQGDEAAIVLDHTCFYAESGGQVGDVGTITHPNMKFEVIDTRKSANGVFLHMGRVIEGEIKCGSRVTASVQKDRRSLILPHHTGTHLLQAALRKVLGDHVQQQGSAVTPEYLRFDFTHTEAMTREQIRMVERLVNEWIQQNYPVQITHTSIDEARQAGAMALFGEKYGEVVRMVKIDPVSRELCGGTHVGNTGEIGPFLIVSEESIQAGVRRITALAGQTAFREIQQRQDVLQQVANMLRCSIDQIPDRFEKLQNQLREKDKMIRSLRETGGAVNADDLLKQSRQVDLNGQSITLLVSAVSVPDFESLEALGDRLKSKIETGIMVLGASLGDKVQFVCSVSKNLTEKFKAGDIVKKVAAITGGGGGGRPDYAKAGGKDVSKMEEALASVPGILGTE